MNCKNEMNCRNEMNRRNEMNYRNEMNHKNEIDHNQRMNYQKETIAALKVILGSLAYQELSVTKTLGQIVKKLCAYYQEFLDEKYLELALLYIKVYLEMGFVYEESKEVFEEVFRLLGEDKENYYEMLCASSGEKKKYSKSDVRSMIRRWSSSKYHTKTIDEVVEDILEKVEKQTKGIYYYHSNENPKQAHMDEVYELVIGDFESYLHDINRNKYYKLA